MGSINEKNGGRKSRDTALLTKRIEAFCSFSMTEVRSADYHSAELTSLVDSVGQLQPFQTGSHGF